MFEEYQNKVLLAYQSKIDAGQLMRLLDISPAMLRQECLNVFKERYDAKNDDACLRTFFGPDEKARGYLKIIDDCPTNKFRALVKFFRKEIAKPDRKNIELLAWLIDFQPRPHMVRDAYEISTPFRDTVKPGGELEPPQDVKPEEPKPVLSNPINTPPLEIVTTITPSNPQPQKEVFGFKRGWANHNIRKAIFAFIAATVVCGATYLFSKNSNQECMYWMGDHYEVISCREKAGDASVIALDTSKVAHLKKIMQPDTITLNATGKVWYAKVKVDSVDFYTAPGEHPTDQRKKLMPVTAYIINKYILHKKNRE